MSILDKLAERKQNKQSGTVRLYRPLLERLANVVEPSEKDVELLDNLTNALDFSRAQVQSDLDVLSRLHDLEDIAANEETRRAEYQRMNILMVKQYEYIQSERIRLDAETSIVERAQGEALAFLTISINAREELAVLRNRFPHLFA